MTNQTPREPIGMGHNQPSPEEVVNKNAEQELAALSVLEKDSAELLGKCPDMWIENDAQRAEAQKIVDAARRVRLDLTKQEKATKDPFYRYYTAIMDAFKPFSKKVGDIENGWQHGLNDFATREKERIDAEYAGCFNSVNDSGVQGKDDMLVALNSAKEKITGAFDAIQEGDPADASKRAIDGALATAHLIVDASIAPAKELVGASLQKAKERLADSVKAQQKITEVADSLTERLDGYLNALKEQLDILATSAKTRVDADIEAARVKKLEDDNAVLLAKQEGKEITPEPVKDAEPAPLVESVKDAEPEPDFDTQDLGDGLGDHESGGKKRVWVVEGKPDYDAMDLNQIKHALPQRVIDDALAKIARDAKETPFVKGVVFKRVSIVKKGYLAPVKDGDAK